MAQNIKSGRIMTAKEIANEQDSMVGKFITNDLMPRKAYRFICIYPNTRKAEAMRDRDEYAGYMPDVVLKAMDKDNNVEDIGQYYGTKYRVFDNIEDAQRFVGSALEKGDLNTLYGDVTHLIDNFDREIRVYGHITNDEIRQQVREIKARLLGLQETIRRVA